MLLPTQIGAKLRPDDCPVCSEASLQQSISAAPAKPPARNSLVPSHLQVHPSSVQPSAPTPSSNPVMRLFNSAMTAVTGGTHNALSAAAKPFVQVHIKTPEHVVAKAQFSSFHNWYLTNLVPCLLAGFVQLQEVNQFENIGEQKSVAGV